MKTYSLFAICFVLLGCGRPEENQREVISKLDAIKAELDKGSVPVRWATAKKSEITSAIFQRSRERLELFKKTEKLSPEIEAQIAVYETLKAELQQKEGARALRSIPTRTLRLTPGGEPPPAPPTDPEIEALSKKVAEAKAPVAAIVDRRDRKAAEYREEHPVDRLIAEYVKDRFDLVVDSSHMSQFNPPVLYRTGGEVPDITQGVIALLKEKAK